MAASCSASASCPDAPLRVAAEMGASRTTGYEWLARWHAEGDAGLHNRSGRDSVDGA
jgi:hypothetical protein